MTKKEEITKTTKKNTNSSKITKNGKHHLKIIKKSKDAKNQKKTVLTAKNLGEKLIYGHKVGLTSKATLKNLSKEINGVIPNDILDKGITILNSFIKKEKLDIYAESLLVDGYPRLEKIYKDNLKYEYVFSNEKTMKSMVEFDINRKAMEKVGKCYKTGYYLSGDFGLGKNLAMYTLIHNRFNKKEDAVIFLTFDKIASGDIKESASNPGKIMEAARHIRDSHEGVSVHIIFDECEKKFGNSSSSSSNSVIMIGAWKEAIQGDNPRIYIYGLTNYYELIDPSLKRPGRISECYTFLPLDFEGYVKTFNHYLIKNELREYISVDTFSECVAKFHNDSVGAAFIEEFCMVLHASKLCKVDLTVNESVQKIVDDEILKTASARMKDSTKRQKAKIVYPLLDKVEEFMEYKYEWTGYLSKFIEEVGINPKNSKSLGSQLTNHGEYLLKWNILVTKEKKDSNGAIYKFVNSRNKPKNNTED